MILEFADAAKLYVPLTRLDLIQKYRSTDTGPAPILNKLGNAGVAEDQGPRQKSHGRHGRRVAQALRAAQGRAGQRLLAGQQPPARIRRRLRLHRDRRPTLRHPRHQGGHGSRPSPWTGCSAATSATARPKSPCAPLSRPCRMASRWPSSRQLRSSRFQHFESFKKAFREFPCEGRNAVALSHREGERPSSPSRPRPAKSTSSSAPTPSSRRS